MFLYEKKIILFELSINLLLDLYCFILKNILSQILHVLRWNDTETGWATE